MIADKLQQIILAATNGLLHEEQIFFFFFSPGQTSVRSTFIQSSCTSPQSARQLPFLFATSTSFPPSEMTWCSRSGKSHSSFSGTFFPLLWEENLFFFGLLNTTMLSKTVATAQCSSRWVLQRTAKNTFPHLMWTAEIKKTIKIAR